MAVMKTVVRVVFSLLVFAAPVSGIALVLAPTAALAEKTPECPEDGSGAYFTGKTRTSVDGHLMYEYKCFNYGHLFWARAP